jgi:hypothetical protein
MTKPRLATSDSQRGTSCTVESAFRYPDRSIVPYGNKDRRFIKIYSSQKIVSIVY